MSNEETPVIRYTSADFASIKDDLMTFAKAHYSGSWTDFSEGQLGTLVLELAAYLGDLLSFQVNAGVREAFAVSAVKLSQLRRIARGFGASEAVADPTTAKVDLTLTLDPAGPWPVELFRGQHAVSDDSQEPVYFTPENDATLTEAEAIIQNYEWIVPFEEGEQFTNVLLTLADGGPGLAATVPADNVLPSSVEVTVGGVPWTRVTTFTGSVPTSLHYTVLREEGKAYVVFGDGQFGAIPPNAAEVRASFRAGGGSRGRVGPEKITTIVAMPAAVLDVVNPLRPVGGTDEPTIRQARVSLAGSFSTLDRAVTVEDYAKLAMRVPGVAAAAARPSALKTNVVQLWIAPAGGGTPTDSLKSAVSGFLSTRKGVGRRVRVLPPYYRDLQVEALLHVAPRFKAADVAYAVERALINANGTGYFDFDQLGFAGLDVNGDPLLTHDRFREALAQLRSRGLLRVEVRAFTVIPVGRPKQAGNSGNGTVNVGTLGAGRRRRRITITMTSANTFTVQEVLPGRVSKLTATTLVDERLDLSREIPSLAMLNGARLYPDARYPNVYVLLDTPTETNTLPVLAGYDSLFTMTEVGADYYVTGDGPLSTGTVGVAFPAQNGDSPFTVVAGTTPFIAGDSFVLDIYPESGDLELAFDEYPRLQVTNLALATSGGSLS